MLQKSGYDTRSYVKWLYRTHDYTSVMSRQTLVRTRKTQLLGLFFAVASLIAFTILEVSIKEAIIGRDVVSGLFAVVFCLLLPQLFAYGIVVPLWLGEKIIQAPRQRRIIQAATAKAASIDATVIAIAGSYGKTSFKEILKTILAESYVVAATPGNKNTPLGTSQFIDSLNGNENIVIFELGETHIGDVRELCCITQPDMGVITGVNEAHLESFGSIENTLSTIFELQDYLHEKPLYANGENEFVASRMPEDASLAYSQRGVNGWTVSSLQVSLSGTKFTAVKGNKTIWVESDLIGGHQVGPLIAAIDIADTLGMSIGNIVDGVKKTKAFEHRMQPLSIGGATIIDDTYNGNIDGIMSGLRLLRDAEATRKIYITPGLVEHGSQTRHIHEKIGKAIAESCDVVVLMKNSVTQHIQNGLEQAGFLGEVMIIDNPLRFYENLDQFVAHGDVVLMQNDWTDNYN